MRNPRLVVGDTAAYRRYLDRMFERYEKDKDYMGRSFFDLAYAGGLLDGAVKAERLVEFAEHDLEHHAQRDQHPELFHVAGIAHYRAGQFEQAIGGWRRAGDILPGKDREATPPN